MSGKPDSHHRPFQLYGRHKAHRLKPRQQRLVDTLLETLRVCPGKERSLAPAGLFTRQMREVWLEIGFGGGEHLGAQAARYRDVGFIGCEPFLNGVAKLLCTIEDEHLDNVRIDDGDARLVLESLEDASIARVFLLYPDPWPKTRHHKRRLVSQWTLSQLHRIMLPGAELQVASDIPDYIRWTLHQVRRHGGFAWKAETPADWRSPPEGWPGTRYEAKALKAGRTPTYLQFIRLDQDLGSDHDTT